VIATATPRPVARPTRKPAQRIAAPAVAPAQARRCARLAAAKTVATRTSPSAARVASTHTPTLPTAALATTHAPRPPTAAQPVLQVRAALSATQATARVRTRLARPKTRKRAAPPATFATGGGNAVCINSVCKVQCDAGFTACVSGCCQAGGLQPVKWKHVSLGTEHSCAVTVAGALKCWGQNSEGQLGNGNKLDNSTPVPVQGLASGVAMAATGIRHSCALTESGAVKCWGQGKNGQLGNIDANDSLLPTNVVGLGSRLVLVGAGEDTSCAVTDGGAVVCWGVIPSSKVPTAVWGLGAVVSPVAIGEAHICVTTTAGELKCLGSNFIGGQLGNGSENSSDKPVDVRGLKTGAATVSAFRYHSCAVTIGGAVRCWGENASGQLGTGSKSLLSAVPVDVVGLATGVSMVATGADHSCALMGTGAVKCWGSNLGRQIGDGDGVTAERLTPVDVHGLDVPIVMIAAGYNHTCAVSKAGVLQCWGSNRYGKLGNRTTIDSAVPVTVVSF
jgi:alpha-tubulin suppressor-like RCC1 family protein